MLKLNLNLNLQNSYDKVKLLTLLQFVLVLVAFISEAFLSRSVLNFFTILQLILLFLGFNFYFSALMNLYYSFWNISAVLVVYYILSLTRNFLVLGHPLIGLLFLTSLFLLIISCYIISSPLYYPRFHWWEYDFRFRADMKCSIEIDGKPFIGRLSDLRRGAACLELFCSVPVGHIMQITTPVMSKNFTLKIEIRSKREPIIGRSFIYGIKFIYQDLEDKQRLRFLTHFWKESKRIKIRNKFSMISKS